MVYLIVAIALLCLTVKGYCGKKTGVAVRDAGDSYLFNLLRMIFCMVIGIALVFFEGAHTQLDIELGMIGVCALAGVANAAFLAGWLLAIQKNTMVSVDVSLTLGSLLPALLCLAFFGEAISLPKMIGFALILAATVILAGYNKKVAGGGVVGVLLLVFAALGDGLSGFAQQLYKHFYTPEGLKFTGREYPKTVYHFYTYVFAAVALLLLFAVYTAMSASKAKKNGKPFSLKNKLTVSWGVVAYIAVMAVCLFAANYLQTVATGDYHMSSQELYPIIKGGCLITVNFVAMIFFKEKITVRSAIGSAVALGGILCMSLL